MAKKELFHEIDGRPGFYVGAQARYLDRAILNVLHYDNRADPTAESIEIRDFAWKTRFDAAALRIETANDWTLLLQAMQGDTASIRTCCSTGISILNPHWSQSAGDRTCWPRTTTASKSYSRMIRPRPAAKPAMPGPLLFIRHGDHWRFALEWLRVESDVPARVEGLSPTGICVRVKNRTFSPLLAWHRLLERIYGPAGPTPCQRVR